MGRHKNVVPTVKLTTMLPVDLHQRLTEYFSKETGEVPTGSFQAFFVARTNEFFHAQRKTAPGKLEEERQELQKKINNLTQMVGALKGKLLISESKLKRREESHV